MARFAVHLLGPMRVLVDDQVVDAAFRTKKERALLAYLAVEARKQHRRETLSELLWPGRPEGYARTNLRQALLGMRKALGGDVLTGGDEYLSYGLLSLTWLDTQAFDTLIQSTLTHNHRSLESCPVCAANLEEAVGLYRGDFLEDMLLSDSHPYQEWVIFHREMYFRQLLSAYRMLSDLYQVQGDYERSYRYAWQYVSVAPLEEAAHRQLMNVLALSGRRSAALEQYQTVRQVLARELGVEPSRETTELYEKIRTGLTLDLEPTILNLRLTNLPTELTSFVGREGEHERLLHCLVNKECRLITLVGTAGVGKTRLAVHSAASVLEKFPDGVWLVPVDDVNNAGLLAARIAKAIGLPFNDREEPGAQLVHLLRPLKTLLLLDGFEHLLEATSLLVELLHQTPGLKIVVTSRRRLNYQAACLFDLQGLPYPQNEHPDLPLEAPAVQLFMARAQQNRTPVQTDATAMGQVVQVCRALDGLPLAIELAAGVLREVSLAHLLGELQRGLDVLTTNLQDVPGQHQSMRMALEPSWNLLNGAEKSVFKKISLLSPEFDLHAASTLAGATSVVLNGLVDQSLLTMTGVGRYRLSPLLRHYAAEKLAETSPDMPGAHPVLNQPAWRRMQPGAQTGALHLELFWDRLEHTLGRASRHKHLAGVLLLDVQAWLAPAAPDENAMRLLLQDTGQRITASLRRADMVSYLGAGNFAIVLDELAAPGDGDIVSAKLLNRLAGMVPGDVQRLVRVGFALYPRDGSEPGSLYATAQERMNN